MKREDLLLHPVCKLDNTNDNCVPVLNPFPLPEDETPLFIKASFVTASGDELDGYIVGDDSFYAFFIFCGTNTLGFNLNAHELCNSSKASLLKHLGKPANAVFPIRYETTLYFRNEPPISGEMPIG